MEMVESFLNLRGNCVFFMDYSEYSSEPYIELLPYFNEISAVLSQKLVEIQSPGKTVLFGFSFGARLAINAAMKSTTKIGKVDKIYACDPAGPGFHRYRIDPTKAANYVECINTSNKKGTEVYNCHRNWRFKTLNEY